MGELKHLFPAVALGLAVAACSASIPDEAWVWCQNNESAVEAAAGTLGLDYDWPWNARTANLTLEEVPAALASDPDFGTACRKALENAGKPTGEVTTGGALTQAELRECYSKLPGGDVDAAGEQMGVQRVHSPTGRPLWSYEGLSRDALRADSDYAKACRAASDARG